MVKVLKGQIQRTERLVVPLFQEAQGPSVAGFLASQGVDSELVSIAVRAVKERAFRGELGEALLLLAPQRERVGGVVFLGLGAEKRFKLESLRRALGSYSRRARKEGVKEVTVTLEDPHLGSKVVASGWGEVAKAVAAAWTLGGYAFDTYKPPAGGKKRPCGLRLRLGGHGAEVDRAIKLGSVSAEAANFTRELANTPANDLYPERLAEHARALARRHRLRFELLKKRDLIRLKMGGILGVGQASEKPPCLITLEYKPRGATRGRRIPTVALVGKAVTFDCGGLSIKPAKGMEEMKFDMAGGAAVLGALEAAARLKLPVRVVGLIPAAENAISGSAMRPGDILRMASGKTVEILNTDAEGRLILADALHYSRRFQPDYVIDFATLTGACVVALGTQVSGLFTNHHDFGRRVFDAGERSGERVWELPLYEEFLEATRSTVADLKNSAGRNAGSLTAAAFLSAFVGETPWCHLDIAGTAWVEREGGPFTAGATGVGVRLVTELLASL